MRRSTPQFSRTPSRVGCKVGVRSMRRNYRCSFQRTAANSGRLHSHPHLSSMRVTRLLDECIVSLQREQISHLLQVIIDGAQIWYLLLAGALITYYPNTADAQDDIRFNIILSDTTELFDYGIGRSLVRTHDGYLVFSIGNFGEITADYNLLVSMVNNEGDVVWNHEYTSQTTTNIGTYGCVLAKDTTSFYLPVSQRDDNSPEIPDSLFLYKFNSDGDTSYTCFVTADSIGGVSGLVWTESGQILMCGTSDDGSGMLLCTDTLGQIAWRTKIPGSIRPSSIIRIPSAPGYIIVGQCWTQCGKPAIVIANDQGQWQQTFIDNDVPFGGHIGAAIASDTTFFVAGWSQPNPLFGKTAMVGMYKFNGERMWCDTVTCQDGTPGSMMVSAVVSSTGTLIASGFRFSTDQGGLLCSYDPDGSLNWLTETSHFQGVSDSRCLSDVLEASNRGFACAGYDDHSIWMIVTDSTGCLVENCHTLSADPQGLRVRPNFLMHPQPCDGFLHITYADGINLIEQPLVRFTSATGHIVLEYRPQLIENSYHVQTEQLDNGYYLVEILGREGKYGAAKLVVCH